MVRRAHAGVADSCGAGGGVLVGAESVMFYVFLAAVALNSLAIGTSIIVRNWTGVVVCSFTLIVSILAISQYRNKK